MRVLLSVVTAGAVALAVSGCAANPKEMIGGLNSADPKYESQACLDARNLALEYNNHVLGRAGMGLALGLLGPIGIALAVGVDAAQNSDRKAVNDEIERRCKTEATSPAQSPPL